jgi:hypothetical protein
LVCVYIKTQSDSALNLEGVKKQGFAVLDRRSFLELLNSHPVDSDIYNDFRERLTQIEHNESQFSIKRIGDWDDNDWKGLYQALEQQRKVVNWLYVPNPAGGFWSAVLNWFDFDDYCPYMQIEQGPLCFKVGEVYGNRRDVRDRFRQLLLSNGADDIGLERPGRLGNGKYMTVAFVPRAVWLGKDDEILDLEATLSRLNRYESWLAGVIANARNDGAEPPPPLEIPQTK